MGQETLGMHPAAYNEAKGMGRRRHNIQEAIHQLEARLKGQTE
ncbi:MAG: hypothetical protein Q8P83_00325 [bacterium]|nr:hypothetical protein [bacterium]